MNIAIISDIHENFHNLILALESMATHNIEQILCLGDLMNSGIAKILAAQDIPTYMIWGNNDGDKVEITLAAKREGSALSVSTNIYGFLELDGKKLFLSHYDDLAKPMAMSGEYDAVFFGHNHIQSTEKVNNCWVVNPGELAALKTRKATYAIYDTLSNEIQIIELQNSVSLKTEKMEAYFATHQDKLNLRSSKAFGVTKSKNVIPSSSKVYQQLEQSASVAKAVVFTGLPGVGKSLYISVFKQLALQLKRNVTIVQWDVARKAFETPEILQRFPMGDGTVHDGIKLCAGRWLTNEVSDWLSSAGTEDLLLIEAPLVGHRFIELATLKEDASLEKFLSSDSCHFLCPIPSSEVRQKIEELRIAQVAEDAKVWMGAKPSVMLMLWKMICGIANEMGRNIPMDGQPEYDSEVYEFVFRKILKHRTFIPLYIEEVFDVNIEDEHDLHHMDSLQTTAHEANLIGKEIMEVYKENSQITEIVKGWYLT